MSRSTQSRGGVKQAGNQGKEQSRRFTPPSPLDMVSPPHLWRRRGSALDGARGYGDSGKHRPVPPEATWPRATKPWVTIPPGNIHTHTYQERLNRG